MRTRLPVKVKVAVVTAALTFVILCLFAVAIGAVAEQRIRDGFDDDLRATSADLQNGLTPDPGPDGTPELSAEDFDLLEGFAAGDAVVRVTTLDGGRLVFPTSDPMPQLGPPIEGVTDAGDLRVVSRELVAATFERPGSFELIPLPVARAVGWVQYAKPEESVERTVNRVRVFLALGVLGGTLLAFLGGLLVAQRAMRPIVGLTRAARVSPAIGLMARWATTRPPRKASRVPPNTPNPRNRRTRLMVLVMVRSGLAYCTYPMGVVTGWSGASNAPDGSSRVGTTSSRKTTRRLPMSETPLIGGPRETPGSLVQMVWLARSTTRTIESPAA